MRAILQDTQHNRADRVQAINYRHAVEWKEVVVTLAENPTTPYGGTAPPP